MKRTKEWWSALTNEERSYLVIFEKYANKSYGSPYLPDDCVECGVCSQPTVGYGACSFCSNRADFIINKANQSCIALKL